MDQKHWLSKMIYGPI